MRQRKPFWGRAFLSILLASCTFLGSAQSFDTLQRKRLVVAGNSVAYAGTMTGLYHLWYKNYPLTSFHFYNDNHEWFQMDKVGHAYSCYYEGVVGIDMMKWAGFNKKQQILIGGAYGFFIQTGVEVLDGFSQEWGASTGDIIANVAGTGLVMGQAALWDEQRIWLKLSFQPSPYSTIRPELLGDYFVTNLFKDYNGQTYWMSINVPSFLKEETKWPKWLNVAVGYGIDGFVSSDDNTFIRDGNMFTYDIPQQRQFYLSPDIDLTRIPVEKRGLRIAFRMLNTLKFPMPGLSYSTKDGMNLHWLAY